MTKFGLTLSTLLLFTVLISVTRSAELKTIECYQCEGINCGDSKKSTPKCEGNYCLGTTFLPAIGHKLKMGEAKFVKGCIKTDTSLAYVDYVNQCLRYREGRNMVKTCICSGNLCNKGAFTKPMKVLTANLVSCDCEGFDYCSKAGKCRGEFCTYVKSLTTKEVSKGCLNTTVPLLEHHLIDTCVTPAFVGGLHHSILDKSTALDYEMCVCADANCNKQRPAALASKAQNCSMELSATIGGIDVKTKRSSCFGEFCFNADVNTASLRSNVLGCINYLKTNEARPETGCISSTAPGVDTKVCFGNAKLQAEESEDEEEEEKKEEDEEEKIAEAEKEEEEEEEEEEEGEEKEARGKNAAPAKTSVKIPNATKPKASKENSSKELQTKGQKEETAEERERNRQNSPRNANGNKVPEPGSSEPAGTKLKEAASPHKAPTAADKEAEEDKEIGSNNSVIIIVFVVIILVIIVVGLAWKFELAKKIFQARYQTVGG